jgi:hypothetical protein
MEDSQDQKKHGRDGTEGMGTGEITALRYTFVEMLFALAIAEVAIVASGIVRAQGTVSAKLPVLSHIFLATVLIAASWLGWSASQWRRNSPKVETLLSWNFVGLLLDVLLVILYFILVRDAEVLPDAPFTLGAPTAVPEARWIIWIFAVYVIWDIVSDVVKEKNARTSLATIGLALASTACSIICVTLAFIASQVAEDARSPWSVILVDAALLSVVLLFRVIKVVLENSLYRVLPRLRKYQAFATLRPGSGRDGTWTALFIMIYLLALGGACLIDCMSASG